MLIIISSQTVGQHRGNPIRPYNENGYTIAEVKAFAVGSTPLSVDYKINLLRIINNAMEKAGETKRFTEKDLSEIFYKYVYHEERVIPSFLNSMDVSGKLEFYEDKNFRGTTGIFQYGKCRLVLYKTICMNLLEVPIEVVQPKEAEKEPTEETFNQKDLPLHQEFNFISSNISKDVYNISRDAYYVVNNFKPQGGWLKRKWWVIPVTLASGILVGVLIDELSSQKTTPAPVVIPSTPGIPAPPRTMPPGQSRIRGVVILRF